MIKFAKDVHKDSIAEAFEYFWGEYSFKDYLPKDFQEMAHINFMEWFIHDWVVDEDEADCLIDLYEKRNRTLSSGELSVLNKMRRAVLSLYEVLEVFPEKGLVLRDLLRGDEIEVSEQSATRTLRKWDIFATRLIRLDGLTVINLGVFPFNIRRKDELVEELTSYFAEYVRDFPGSTMNDFLKTEGGEFFNDCWCDFIIHPVVPALVNTSGDPLVVAKARFSVIGDAKEVWIKAQGVKDFEKRDKGIIHWMGRNTEKKFVMFGSVKITGKKLTLECNSKKRLEKGKKLLLKHLAGMIAHDDDTFDEATEVLRELQEGRKPSLIRRSDDDMPFEEAQKFYEEYMRKHYNEWLAKASPALGGKTPLVAVMTKEGRTMVAELLKYFENGEEHNKLEGRPHFDVSWMWKKLGIPRDEYQEPQGNLPDKLWEKSGTVVPSVPPDVWRKLYVEADKFRKLAPWKYMSDDAPFAVKDPESDQTYYCCVIGSLGQVFGLAAFRGAEGWDVYRRTRAEESEGSPSEWITFQNALFVDFTDPSYLEPEDVANVARFGLFFKGKNSTPMFRSFLPGYAQWFLTTAEAVALTKILHCAALFTVEYKKKSEAFCGSDDNVFTYLLSEGADEKQAVETKWLAPDQAKEADVPDVSLNQFKLRQLQKIKPNAGFAWESDFFYKPDTLLLDFDRPYLLRLALVVDGESGFLFHAEAMPHDSNPHIFLAECVIKAIEGHGIVPGEIQVKNKASFEALKPLAKQMGITVTLKPRLPAVAEARKGLDKFEMGS
ncbi:MAG: DUF2384 domain-containing protein [Nitrospinae bacterium]|nr:DUF2384 domain-containing protein [Nitrospinota bacterium]